MTAYRAALCVGAAVSAAWVLGSTPAHAAPWTPGPVPNIQHKVAPRSGPIPDADKAFMALVRAIPGTTILDPAIVEAGGRNVCSQYLEAGRTRANNAVAGCGVCGGRCGCVLPAGSNTADRLGRNQIGLAGV